MTLQQWIVKQYSSACTHYNKVINYWYLDNVIYQQSVRVTHGRIMNSITHGHSSSVLCYSRSRSLKRLLLISKTHKKYIVSIYSKIYHDKYRVRSVSFFCHWIIINFWSSGFFPVGYRTHPGSWMDPVDAFFWVYRTHRNIKSSGSSKIHWIWYLAFSKIWIYIIQWIKSSGWNPFFCPSSGLGRSTGCLPNAL